MDNVKDLAIEIIGAFLCFLIGILWFKFIIPYFRNIFYHGINISGKWKMEYLRNTAEGNELTIERDTIIELEQYGNIISGKATSISKSEGINDVTTFNVHGEIKDRFVTINFKFQGKNRMAYSLFLLEIMGNGGIMKGYWSFYGLKTKSINATKCVWKQII